MAALVVPAVAQPCEPHWSRDFPDGGLQNPSDVRALAVFDDGTGLDWRPQQYKYKP